MNKINSFLVFMMAIATFQMNAQQEITLENIWRDYTFYAAGAPGFSFLEDGKHYSDLSNNQILRYDLTTGAQDGILFNLVEVADKGSGINKVDGYSFAKGESKILIKTETEQIYRHSTKANFYVFDANTKTFEALFDGGKQRYATFSPDGKKVAFVHENNMYCKDLASGKMTQITSDGEMNSIINGANDWVYEEEFAFSRSFFWSGDSKKIAFYRFDESNVPEFTMTMYNDDMYPEYSTFKYPKVGEQNATVGVRIYDVTQDKTLTVELGDEEFYIPRLKWTQDPNKLCVFYMNRHQNELALLSVDATTGDMSPILVEKNKYYIDIDDDLTFLEDGKHFIWTSEKSGYKHIYLYDMSGQQVRQITKGENEVLEFYGYDAPRDKLYFKQVGKTPMQHNICTIDLKGKECIGLMTDTGVNKAQFSVDYSYFVHNHSTLNQAPVITVRNNMGKVVRIIEENKGMAALQSTFGTTPVEFFDFKTSTDVSLNGWMIKPPNFDKSKEYPVFMYLYGGPGSQQVVDQWKGQNYWWFQMLAQQGYIVACVDNRGTGGRGEEFKKMTYLQLGKYETEDQIEAAKYLGALPYADASRIGIFGWSYGGYMSSLCLFKGNDVFKAAIAVAPVTNWKWYDSIYTERYMRTMEENKAGYEENSPVYFADQLKGNYLLVHGMGDDNVHFQHTAEMYRQLISKNKQFDTYAYPNKNHGIYGGLTRLHLYTKMTNFIMEKL